jgi:hypothetical protein
MTPGVAPGRHWEADPYFAPTATYPYKGSALIYWDSGNATPPNGNLPNGQGSDPHGHPRSEPAGGWQEAEFLLTGWNVDVCGGGYYLTLKNPINNGTPSCHAPTWEPGTVDPAPVDNTTSLAFTSGSATEGQYTDATKFQARLTDATGSPISGAEVTYALSNSGAERTFTAVTDGDGVATVTPTITEKPGSYSLAVDFAGDANRDASANSTNFLVTKEESLTRLAASGKGSKRTLTATLTDLDSGTGVAGRTIQFSADGTVFATATTGSDGSATISIPSRFQGGHHTFEANFAGDDFFLSSADRWAS